MSEANPYQGYHAQLLEKLDWLRRENAALKKQANGEFDAVITRNMELERENAELREARDQLTADFRAQAKQLTQCNRELAQQISQRKIREKLAAMQKEVAP